MTTLANLISELQSEVPAVNSVPTTAQYTQAIKDAVADFSRRCGLKKIGSLAIVSGIATYDLPADFIDMISMDALIGVDGVIVSNNGLIPLSKDFEEEWTIVNKQITFRPTPGYSMTRGFKYKSGWIATNDDYTTLGDNERSIVMLKAKAIASEKIMRAQNASGAVKYSFGAVSVDKSAGSEDIGKSIFQLHGEYVSACEIYNGNIFLTGGG